MSALYCTGKGEGKMKIGLAYKVKVVCNGCWSVYMQMEALLVGIALLIITYKEISFRTRKISETHWNRISQRKLSTFVRLQLLGISFASIYQL